MLHHCIIITNTKFTDMGCNILYTVCNGPVVYAAKYFTLDRGECKRLVNTS